MGKETETFAKFVEVRTSSRIKDIPWVFEAGLATPVELGSFPLYKAYIFNTLVLCLFQKAVTWAQVLKDMVRVRQSR